MTIESKVLAVAFAAALMAMSFGPLGASGSSARAQNPGVRIISLVPALTDMLLGIDAGPHLVAVSSYDDDPAVAGLPRVGALLDPDVERILAIRPTLVLLYGSQVDLITQLSRAAIPYYAYRHGGLAHVTETIRALGERTDRRRQADRLAGSIERRLEALRVRTGREPKPRVLLVFGRERGSLRNIYASGGRGFLHEMLEAAGGLNVLADVDAESLQVSTEIILARAPEVIVELRSIDIPSEADRQQEIASWEPLASVPAVRTGRVYLLSGRSLVVPATRVADSAERIAGVLHHDRFGRVDRPDHALELRGLRILRRVR